MFEKNNSYIFFVVVPKFKKLLKKNFTRNFLK